MIDRNYFYIFPNSKIRKLSLFKLQGTQNDIPL